MQRSSSKKRKFKVNTIFICVIFRLGHANSSQRQRAQRIKGGHSASSPAVMAEEDGEDECADRKVLQRAGGGRRVPSGGVAYKT